jgi:hypothetical protein
MVEASEEAVSFESQRHRIILVLDITLRVSGVRPLLVF